MKWEGGLAKALRYITDCKVFSQASVQHLLQHAQFADGNVLITEFYLDLYLNLITVEAEES